MSYSLFAKEDDWEEGRDDEWESVKDELDMDRDEWEELMNIEDYGMTDEEMDSGDDD